MKSLFQKRTKSNTDMEIVVISGLPRSGTSMMMKMLEVGGLSAMTDSLRVADEDNPKGYYEFERVKQLDKGDTSWVPEARGKVIKVISALLKFLPANEQYKVIFIRRNMPEILASQRKMLINRGEDPDKMDDAQMAMLFEKHVQQIEAWLTEQPNFDVLYVHYSDILNDPVTESQRIAEFLGERVNAEAMVEVVDPELYRNRQTQLSQ